MSATAPSRRQVRSVVRRAAVAVLSAAVVAALLAEGSTSEAAGTGRITGTVTGPGGALGGVIVSAYRKDPSGGWSEVAYDNTDSDGFYDVGGLDDGQYTLGFYDEAGGSAREYWDDVSALSLADDFTVSGDTVAGKDAVLAPGRHLRGTVRGDGGAPLAGVEVSAYPAEPVGGEQVVVEYDVTDQHGAFDIGRLPVGSYSLGFRDNAGSYVSEFWMDQPDLARATDIQVSDDVAGLDAVLARPAQPTPPPPTQPATPAVVSTTLPRIKGQAVVGKRLRVVAGAWNPGGVTLTYQWLVKGKPVKGATRSVLKLKATWRGKKLTVRVTAVASGYTPKTVTTKPSKKIKPRKK